MCDKKPGIAIIKGKTGSSGWNGVNVINVKISVNVSKSKKIARVTVKFTEDAAKAITDSQYIIPRIDLDNNRIYFEGSDLISGFKITAMSKNTRVIVFTCPKEIECSDSFKGVYSLDFDSQYKMHFIKYRGTS